MNPRKPPPSPATNLPEPGIKKRNPEELDRELEQALEDSMDASDPPAVTQPDVHPAAPNDRKRKPS